MIYLLAEPQQEIIKQVFSGKFKKPQIDYLFDNTEMPSLKETGPVLVTDPTIDTNILKQLLEKNSGLLITSVYPKEQVLAQLRHILLVYFKPDQIGIFRYYDPYIASYFFPSLNEQETANWLGPIEKIEWFNTDWCNKVNQPDQWQQKHNPQVNSWHADTNKLSTKPVLSKNQHLALQDMQEEKFAYQWQQNVRLNTTEVDINTTIYWVKEAIHVGCWQTAEINNYLNIRSCFPIALLPEQWPDQEIKQKLIYLERHFQTNI